MPHLTEDDLDGQTMPGGDDLSDPTEADAGLLCPLCGDVLRPEQFDTGAICDVCKADQQAEQTLKAMAGKDAYERTGRDSERPAYIAAAQKRHEQFPTLSREPLDLFMLHEELTDLFGGDRAKAFAAFGLFARYLDTVLLDLADQGQHKGTWDYDRVQGLVVSLADQLEGRN